ncbi:hypothetical protein GMAR_ORF221 [Golden Marseillevirus]|uniref:hypothetical protein n=1 Tax=Golden Marseillevirus TaxID=1720526 RepID=UPI000877AC81|nr:hypothetical protein GMAR_ORF221 [Golden Marseillevirus]ALX27595.1 hypothetical protein GMAR_ORF221 [Golden Marseillevirus]
MIRTLVDPTAPPLNDSELSECRDELRKHFPRVSRGLLGDPPIPGQQVVNISFYPMEKPENGKYGFVRVRGVWPSVELANQSADKIFKEHDSSAIIFSGPVGALLPFTLDTSLADSVEEVSPANADEQQQKMREKIIQQSVEKERKLAREIEERKKMALEEGQLDDDPQSLEYYTKRRVAKRQAEQYIQEYRDRIESMKRTAERYEREIEELDEKYPSHKDNWLNLYNEERKKMGYDPVSE